jgi:hypothetical protein
LLRGLVRLIGFLLIAAAFVAGVMDGARSIAASGLDYAKLGETGFRLLGERFLQLQPAVERSVHPLAWDPVLVSLLQIPTSLMLLGLGLLIYRLGKRPPERIGQLLRN